jgi:hypothetical protein
MIFIPQIYKIFSTDSTKNSINKNQPTSASTYGQATPPLRAIRLFFGVAIFLHWVGRFCVGLRLVLFLCSFGFGGGVGGLWSGSCNPLRLLWLGWVASCFFCNWGGVFVATFAIINLIFVATFGIINLTL